MVKRKKVEPLPCLCGGKMSTIKYADDDYALECCNPKCPVEPVTRAYRTQGSAVRGWNRWIINGVKRLAKVIEEEGR